MTNQRTDNFVPLTTASASDETREFRVTVIPQSDAAKSFKTLNPVSGDGAKSVSAEGNKNCEPRLSLQRDGGRVTNIRIQCACGQMIDLACVYDESPKTP